MFGWLRSRAAAAAGLLMMATGAAMPVSVQAEPGVFPDRIIFGQAAALEGPASALGRGMREGILAAFAEANATGGVNGRKLELVSEDDGYEPKRTIEATKKLIDNNVFALIGSVGTPTSAASKPIAEAAGVPFIGPFTGADILRNPFQRNVVNVRASYFEETEVMVERLTTDLGIKRIAILFQDDAFGRAGYDGTVRALSKRGMQLVAEGTFERNTTAVRGGLLAIRRGEPEAVITIGTYQPIAEFVRLARRIKLNAVFLTVSFVGADALAQDIGAEGDGLVITQVVPFPLDPAQPAVQRYQAALKASTPEAKPGFVSLEGYLVGRLAIETLRKAGPSPSRSGFLDTLYGTGAFDIDGLTMRFGSNDNQGLDQVFLTAIRGAGEIKPLESLRELAR